ncbi:MAG: glycosyltransferase family 39 protein [Acidimicrobiia bacterium]
MRLIAIIAIASVLVAAIVLRFLARSPLWLDEAITTNIAALPLRDIPGALRVDGAPPLTYVLLHVWISVFGSSTASVRALPALLSLIALPLAYIAGGRIARDRGPAATRVGAWGAVLLVASSPFAARYATEARMYSLQIVLVFAGIVALQSLIERPTWPRTFAVAACTAALLYNHYWSLYLIAVVGLGCIAAWRFSDPDARLAPRRAVLALILGSLAFVPWLPTLAYQMTHTGTPWGAPPAPPLAMAWMLIDFHGGDWWAAWPLVLASILLCALALFGRPESPTLIQIDLRTVRGVRMMTLAAGATALLALSIAWVLGAAVQVRYGAVVFPLVVLAVAFGLTAFRDRRIVVGLLIVFTGFGLVTSWHVVRAPRTQAGAVAAVMRADAKPGDLVLYCPDQLGPDASRLMPTGLVQRAFPDSSDPSRIDWTDYATRMRSVAPTTFANDALALAGPGTTIWVVWQEGYRHVTGTCDAILDRLSEVRRRKDRFFPDSRYGEAQGLAEFAGSSR